jgi:hypothetical protein
MEYDDDDGDDDDEEDIKLDQIVKDYKEEIKFAAGCIDLKQYMTLIICRSFRSDRDLYFKSTRFESLQW